jgi:hypothetical protein
VLREIAEHGIVLQQVRQRFGIRNVVYSNELNVPVSDRGAHNIASDAAKSVDAYLDGHSSSDGGVISLRPAEE